ncbi:ABC transporter permease [Clostridium sp. C105KSO13]|uniref:ABC transporter permease n=1 Tax=Clostridium sp. C105KSO13 TaxID=1776045 RepID=UPI0007406BC3|nr:ABC transporter permease [Clostridium sp. C105KSO13]CUX20342.1 Glutathione transport system permease protein GsiC [Clostridium sp. C105KSO13]
MKFVIRKLTGLIITLLIVSIFAFLAFEVIPGDPARSILGTEATESKVQALREEMGLNRPLPQRYGRWLKDFMMGDMGTSYSYQTPVREMIGDKVPITLTLTAIAFLFILLFSIPVSVLCVRYKNKFIDRLFTILNQIVMSVPPFFIGIVFTVLFGLLFRLFTPGGYVSYKESMGGFLKYLILPGIAIALPKAAMTIKLFRNSLLAQMRQDYVRTAQSRGNNPWRVLLRHVMRNGILPVTTFLGMVIADMIANSIVIEQVFGIPGLGRTLISSISKRDYPVVEAIIVLIATVILMVNVLVDLLYQKLDRRIEV